MSLVLPGLAEVWASLLLLVSALINDDFPTLLRPINAYSANPVLGHSLSFAELFTNMAFLTVKEFREAPSLSDRN